MDEHTPAPWHIGLNPGPIIYGPKGETVADLFVPMLPKGEHMANARLIARAPAVEAAARALLMDAIDRGECWDSDTGEVYADWESLSQALGFGTLEQS